MKHAYAICLIGIVGCTREVPTQVAEAKSEPKKAPVERPQYLNGNPFSHPALLAASQVSQAPQSQPASPVVEPSQLAPAPLTGNISVVPTQPHQSPPKQVPKHEDPPTPRSTVVLKAVVDAGSAVAYVVVDGKDSQPFSVGEAVVGEWRVLSIASGEVVLAAGAKRLTLSVGQTLEVPS